MKRIYLTARLDRRDQMRKHRETLIACGHKVTSRWLDEADGTPPADAAEIDLEDIDVSNVLIAFSETPDVGYYTGGRHVELGYALARQITVIIVGPRENVFMHLPEIKVANTFAEAVKLLV